MARKSKRGGSQKDGDQRAHDPTQSRVNNPAYGRVPGNQVSPSSSVQVQLRLFDGRKYDLEFDAFTPARHLAVGIIQKLGLPAIEPHGSPVMWDLELVSNNISHRFSDDDIVAEFIDRYPNCYITLYPRVTAG